MQRNHTNTMDAIIFIQKLKEMIKRDPKNIVLHFYLGIAYSDIADYDKAVQKFIEIVDIDRNFCSKELLDDAYKNFDNFDRITIAIEIANKLKPNNAVIHYHLAVAYYVSKRYLQAIDVLKKAINLQKDNNLCYHLLG